MKQTNSGLISKVDFYSCASNAESRFKWKHRKPTPHAPLKEIETVFKQDGIENTTPLSTIGQVDLWYTMSVYICLIFDIPYDRNISIMKKSGDIPILSDVYYTKQKLSCLDRVFDSTIKLDIHHLYPTIIYHNADKIRTAQLTGPFDIIILFKRVYEFMLSTKHTDDRFGPVMKAWFNMTYGMLISYEFYEMDPMVYINAHKAEVCRILYDELDTSCIHFDVDSAWYINGNNEDGTKANIEKRMNTLSEILPTITYKLINLKSFIFIRKHKYIEIYQDGSTKIKGFKKYKPNS